MSVLQLEMRRHNENYTQNLFEYETEVIKQLVHVNIPILNGLERTRFQRKVSAGETHRPQLSCFESTS